MSDENQDNGDGMEQDLNAAFHHPDLPKSLWLGALEIPVRVMDWEQLAEVADFFADDEEPAHHPGTVQGMYISHYSTVLLDKNASGHRELEILLHELAHAFFCESDISHGELHCTAVAKGIINLFVENPAFAQWFNQRVYQIRERKRGG